MTAPSQGSSDLGNVGVMEVPELLADTVDRVGVPLSGLLLPSVGGANEVRWLGTAV